MKKFSNALSSFLFSIAFLATLGTALPVLAQTTDDQKLADYIEQRTNRSFAGADRTPPRCRHHGRSRKPFPKPDAFAA